MPKTTHAGPSDARNPELPPHDEDALDAAGVPEDQRGRDRQLQDALNGQPAADPGTESSGADKRDGTDPHSAVAAPVTGQPDEPERPAGNASTDAWRAYVAAMYAQDSVTLPEGFEDMHRAELQQLADTFDWDSRDHDPFNSPGSER